MCPQIALAVQRTPLPSMQEAVWVVALAEAEPVNPSAATNRLVVTTARAFRKLGVRGPGRVPRGAAWH